MLEAECLGGLFRSVFFAFFVLCLCVVVLFDLGSFWDAKMRRFGSQKSIKMRLMSFCLLLIFYWFSHYFCVLGGSYVGSISVLFSHCFLHLFLVDLGDDLGVVWGGFGDPNRSFEKSILG